MISMLTVNCQSSIKITGEKIIYFDPLKVEESHDADLILITHTHWDHFSTEDILKIKKDTEIWSNSIRSLMSTGFIISPGRIIRRFASTAKAWSAFRRALPGGSRSSFCAAIMRGRKKRHWS